MQPQDGAEAEETVKALAYCNTLSKNIQPERTIEKIQLKGKKREADPTSRDGSDEQTSCEHIADDIEGHLSAQDIGPRNEAGALANSKKRTRLFQRKKEKEDGGWKQETKYKRSSQNSSYCLLIQCVMNASRGPHNLKQPPVHAWIVVDYL